jgi:ABC-type transporter Mla MlaB component
MPIDLPCRKNEEVEVTLRITRVTGSRSRAKLKLEGSVAAEWAALLQRECSDLLRSWGAVSLDLADVSFVDRAGVEALERLSRAGVEIRCRSGPVASVLEGEGIPVTRDADGVNDGQP